MITTYITMKSSSLFLQDITRLHLHRRETRRQFIVSTSARERKKEDRWTRFILSASPGPLCRKFTIRVHSCGGVYTPQKKKSWGDRDIYLSTHLPARLSSHLHDVRKSLFSSRGMFYLVKLDFSFDGIRRITRSVEELYRLHTKT